MGIALHFTFTSHVTYNDHRQKAPACRVGRNVLACRCMLLSDRVNKLHIRKTIGFWYRSDKVVKKIGFVSLESLNITEYEP
jgi:hypothetical protein